MKHTVGEQLTKNKGYKAHEAQIKLIQDKLSLAKEELAILLRIGFTK